MEDGETSRAERTVHEDSVCTSFNVSLQLTFMMLYMRVSRMFGIKSFE